MAHRESIPMTLPLPRTVAEALRQHDQDLAVLSLSTYKRGLEDTALWDWVEANDADVVLGIDNGRREWRAYVRGDFATPDASPTARAAIRAARASVRAAA